MVNYREKYLKYKLKYLNLKNKKSIGGARLVGEGKDQEQKATDNAQADNAQADNAQADNQETIINYT